MFCEYPCHFLIPHNVLNALAQAIRKGVTRQVVVAVVDEHILVLDVVAGQQQPTGLAKDRRQSLRSVLSLS